MIYEAVSNVCGMLDGSHLNVSEASIISSSIRQKTRDRRNTGSRCKSFDAKISLVTRVLQLPFIISTARQAFYNSKRLPK